MSGERAHRAARQQARAGLWLGVDVLPGQPRGELGCETGGIEPIEPIGPAVPAGVGEGAEPTGSGDASALLELLAAEYESRAPHNAFVTSFTNIVFGEGDPEARLMFIGEAPGAEEDASGRPFVGRAGQLLNKMISAMGLTREGVYIANVLKTRPPNNATPTIEEASACAPFLYEQIAIVNPDAIVTLGLPATRLILETNETMGRLRGRWGSFRMREPLDARFTKAPGHRLARGVVPVMPTYHPAYLLRAYTTENRQKVWSDLQQVIDRLALTPPG